MKNFIQPGDSLELTAPVGGVVGGKAYQIGKLIVVAAGSADAAAKFSGNSVGVYELTKTSGQVYTEGQQLYLITATNTVTDTANSGANPPVGMATEAAASLAVLCKVKLSSALNGA